MTNLLLNDKRVDPSFDSCCCIELATKYGHIDIVKLLLKDDRVNIEHNYSFELAAEYGHINLISLFLEKDITDPSKEANQAIYLAHKEGHFNIADLLWSNEKVKSTLQKDNFNLYNIFKKEEVKNKVSEF